MPWPAAKGLGATTVRDVAAEMGTSSGLVHHYFASMDEVLVTAFEQVAGADLAVAETAVAETHDPVAALLAFFGTYAPSDADRAFQLWLDAWSEAPRRPALRAVSRRLNEAWQARAPPDHRLGGGRGPVPLSGPGCDGVAVAVPGRRAGAADRRARDDRATRGCAAMDASCRGAGARATGRDLDPCRAAGRSPRPTRHGSGRRIPPLAPRVGATIRRSRRDGRARPTSGHLNGDDCRASTALEQPSFARIRA